MLQVQLLSLAIQRLPGKELCYRAAGHSGQLELMKDQQGSDTQGQVTQRAAAEEGGGSDFLKAMIPQSNIPFLFLF